MELTPEAITQATAIGDVDELLHGSDTVLARSADSLLRLAEMAVDRPGCRVLSVVDEAGRLIGLVPVRLLVNDIFLKVVPEEFLGVITDVEDVMEYARHLRARTAADIMLPPTSVRRDATVRAAFETMHHARLNGLPIVDEDGRVISYLDQLELLLVWVRASGRGPLLRPSPGAEADSDAG
ncbi:MAG TPA: CBS domain-containing protein [Candidatus Limnocylindria bacterium]|nr:CBS domain-containing protein [Candidatus Limnocylindria bacterium]